MRQPTKQGGDSSRREVSLGELDGGMEGPEPISGTGICSFVQGRTGQNPTK